MLRGKKRRGGGLREGVSPWVKQVKQVSSMPYSVNVIQDVCKLYVSVSNVCSCFFLFSNAVCLSFVYVDSEPKYAKLLGRNGQDEGP